ncbi:MAG: hypothetical protein ACI8Z7_000379 [Candidatus Nanohaloarchaea archaeon]|jgi:hypothetical protein
MSDLSEEIQEIKQELQQVKERNRELEQKIEQQESGKTETAEEKRNISRRKFLKMAGLGAGAIGLSSATSAWSILQPSSQGTSDIDAETVDGSEAGGFIQASETDDGSDITVYRNVGSGYSDIEETIVSINGSGTLLGGYAITAGPENNDELRITVDGSVTQNYTPVWVSNGDDGFEGNIYISPIKFQSSLEVGIYGASVTNNASGIAFVKQ